MSKLSFDRDKLLNVLKIAKDKEKNDTYIQDERMYSPELPNKDGKTANVFRIRFLPLFIGMDLVVPEIKYFFHQYKSSVTGQWVKENCPATFKNPCPICELSRKLWNSGTEADKEAAKPYMRKDKYVSNILVVKELNEKRKSNEGKVFMYAYGKKIHDKIQDALFPAEESGKESLSIYDPTVGFDFLLTIKWVSTFPNYDSSDFARTPSAIGKNSDEIQEILTSTYDLAKEFLSPSNFKSYNELREILNKTASGVAYMASKATEEAPPHIDDEDVPAFSSPKAEPLDSKKVESSSTMSDDDYVKSLEKELGI